MLHPPTKRRIWSGLATAGSLVEVLKLRPHLTPRLTRVAAHRDRLPLLLVGDTYPVVEVRDYGAGGVPSGDCGGEAANYKLRRIRFQIYPALHRLRLSVAEGRQVMRRPVEV